MSNFDLFDDEEFDDSSDEEFACEKCGAPISALEHDLQAELCLDCYL